MSTIIALAIIFFFTALMVMLDLKRLEKRIPAGRVQMSFNNKQAWPLEETILVAYITLNYKMSNKDLISFVSNILHRDESAVIRKMNRIRGIGTGKSPRASKDDITAYNKIEYATPELAKRHFDDARLDLCIVGNSYRNLELLLDNSVSTKLVLAVA